MPPPPRGRPRDPRLDQAITAATVELLLEAGYQAMSLEQVARRAGVARASIYRRWPTKAHLVFETVFTRVGPDSVPDLGSLDLDIAALVGLLRQEFSAPPAVAAANGVLADFAADDAFRAHVQERFFTPTAQAMRQVLHHAVARGEIAEDAPVDLIVETLAGAVFFRSVVLGGQLDDIEAEHLVRIVLDGIRFYRTP